jgi:D-glycero-D-manno-heptose 1,7-bisphosphate phosphatase
MGITAVFLDRDGVLNQSVVRRGKPYPPASLDELVLADGAADACKSLVDAGFVLIGVTNQPDVSRGTTDLTTVEAINRVVQQRMRLSEMRVCLHDDIDQCACRKPKPGMLIDAAALMNIDLKASVTVGDRWRDVAAGRAAGTATVFIDLGYDERRPNNPDHVATSLAEAVPWIIEYKRTHCSTEMT